MRCVLTKLTVNSHLLELQDTMVDSEPPVLLFLGRVANPELFLGFPFSRKLSKFAAETRGTRNIFRPD